VVTPRVQRRNPYTEADFTALDKVLLETDVMASLCMVWCDGAKAWESAVHYKLADDYVCLPVRVILGMGE
jgi:hypothetical protein